VIFPIWLRLAFPQHLRRLRVVLAALATAAVPSDMSLPGARLHPLRGDRMGQWSVSISGNWRMIFEFEGQHVTNVDSAVTRCTDIFLPAAAGTPL
jgi:plasmid maintenance system killer protein